MKEEYRRIISELGITSIPNLSYKSRFQLMLTKRKVAVLLMAKVTKLALSDKQKCKAENGLTKLPTSSVKRWSTTEQKQTVLFFSGLSCIDKEEEELMKLFVSNKHYGFHL